MKFGGVFLQILAATIAALIVGGVIGSQAFPTIVRETLTNTILETVSTTTTLVSTETLTQTTSVTTTNTVTVRETLYRTLTVTSTPTVVVSVTTTLTFTPPPRQVRITSNLTIQYPPNARYRGSLPAVEVRGEVKNFGSTCVASVKVIATFYDSQGRVIGSDFDYTDPDRLDPGQAAPFNILWSDILAPLHNRTSLQVSFRDC